MAPSLTHYEAPSLRGKDDDAMLEDGPLAGTLPAAAASGAPASSSSSSSASTIPPSGPPSTHGSVVQQGSIRAHMGPYCPITAIAIAAPITAIAIAAFGAFVGLVGGLLCWLAAKGASPAQRAGVAGRLLRRFCDHTAYSLLPWLARNVPWLYQPAQQGLTLEQAMAVLEEGLGPM